MMNPEPQGGVDPRVDFIAQRMEMLKQLQQQQMAAMHEARTNEALGLPPPGGHGQGLGGHGHSHGGQGAQGGHSHNGEPCDGHGHNPVQLNNIMQRMQNFLQKQEQGEIGVGPQSVENVAKVRQVMDMIQQMQTGGMMGGAMMMPGPLQQQQQQQNNAALLPHQTPDLGDKIHLMAGDIAADAPHRKENWMAYSGENGTGPQESMLYGGGHFSPPVFGWGELVKTPDLELDRDNKKKNCCVDKKNQKTHSAFMMPHETDTTGAVIHKTLPLIGRIRFLTDIQGLFFWSVVVMYWIVGNFSTWFCILLPQYYDGNLSIKWLLFYGAVSVLCITSHLRASTLNPGKIPYYVSEQSVDHPDWSYCHQCDQKRPPRAHHCRRCKQCVMKMDHHCPWINNCVGEENQWAFVLLITYAQLLSLSSLTLNLLWYYRMPPCQACDPSSFAIFHSRALVNTVTVMAVLMIIFSMGLLCSQHMSIMLDFTTLEWMQLERSVTSSGKMPEPSDMPRVKKNIFRSYMSLCGDTLFIWWPFPCRRRRAPTLKRMEDV